MKEPRVAARFPGVSVTYYPENAMNRMYEEVAEGQLQTIVIGYVVMLVFVVASQYSRDPHHNLWLLGLAGFVFVLCANAAAYGLMALSGYTFNPTMTQALPFLALGLGVDDLFLLLHAYKGVMKHFRGGKKEVLVALTMMEATSRPSEGRPRPQRWRRRAVRGRGWRRPPRRGGEPRS